MPISIVSGNQHHLAAKYTISASIYLSSIFVSERRKGKKKEEESSEHSIAIR
jgi:hypothetical protein